ncbi:MAG: Fe-S protein assembly chaperone HscA [Proteobacteria bacterium]|nr:Fe-S protein assembly chaperone HscA [Pseudomonadota bacterium]NCA28322.1 Fe-S protein assembly chaperone HscA [Pseudomonadota bacterium]
MALLQIQEPVSDQQNQAHKDIVVGIDLGTTNSLIGFFNGTELKIFEDENDQNMISSRVVYDKSGNLIGVGSKPSGHYEISSIKRLMGKNYADLKNINLQNYDFHNLIIDNSSNKEAISLQIAHKKISAIEISAEILKHLKKIAERHLGQEVSKAVITVPAYFDDNAKTATKQSATLAGLDVLRLINEPTAGALAFGLQNKSIGTYLVYDLGGGTFDVSILKMQQGVFKVLGVSGNNDLGGDDFDKILLQKGYKNAKNIKEELSFKETSHGLSRHDFENFIKDKIDHTIHITKNLLHDLDIEFSTIDGVILIGGSTRIPLIQKKLAEIFGKDKILTNLDPDRVVAIGACYQAFNLSHSRENLLLDVNPLSLGIEMMGGIVDKIIYRNSTIPFSKSKEFTTYADNQTAMKFHIVQGEREFAHDCRSLAEFEVKNIPPLKAGLARVKINFTLDADGLLIITSEEKYTGQKQEIIVRPSFGLDESKIKNILLESLKNSKIDMEQRLLAEAIVEAQRDIEIISNDLTNPEINLETKEKDMISQQLEKLKEFIAQNTNRDSIHSAHQELSRVSENLILQKVNKILKAKIAGQKVDDL